MKKLLIPFMVFLFSTACKKEDSSNLILSENIESKSANSKKVDVCHYDATTGKSKTISISENALKAHLDHGDLMGDCSAVLTTICDQDWMVKNLDVTTYRNGDPIPQVTDAYSWVTSITGAWCYYENNTANGPIYGKIYNWYAVNDPRGLAPKGWHVPSDAEWTTLSDCLGGESISGGKMKSTGTIEAGTGLWLSPNVEATNSSGFTGLPGGVNYDFFNFGFIGATGVWWSSTGSSPFVWYRSLNNLSGSLSRNMGFKNYGMYIRCVRN